MTELASTKPAAKPAAAAAATPMMAQYLALKEQAGDALLFYRMGDFYELFFEDAERAAAALDIALTKRGKHAGAEVAMCGVPAATAEPYLAKLIERGFRVAVCEQTEDPKEAKKRGPKEPVRRAIVRVVTPGTITEDALLDARAPAWIAAVARGRGDAIALAWADLTTGAFHVASRTRGALAEELAALRPKELLAAEDVLDADARAVLARDGGAATPWPAAKFDARAGRRRLESLYGVQAIEAFGAFEPAEIAAAGALADYVALTQAGGAPALAPPARAETADAMAIDPAARASLEIERTMSGGRRGALLDVIDRTLTGPGARLMSERLARPLTDPAAIGARLDAVAFFLEARDGRGRAVRATAREILKAAGDPARAASRLLLGRGGPRDLAMVARGLEAGDKLAAALDEADAPVPHALAKARAALAAAHAGADAGALGRLREEIARTLADEPPTYARDGGFVREGVDAALDDARALRDESRRVVGRLQARYAEQTGIAALKVKHNNQLGYFIEVSSRHGGRLLEAPLSEAFRHRQTMANAMRFSTDELVALEAKIAGAAERALAIETEIFERLVGAVRADVDTLRAAAAALAEIDVAAGLAEWAEETGASRPEVDASRAFLIEGGRHPAVEAARAKAGEGPFTPNDCALDGAGAEAPRLLVVTGPNMAGKSTFLRQNALIAVLAQAGSYVPARRARIGVVDRLFSRVGAGDDLARGRSTFMTEMIETAAILNQSGPRALVILDEIGRGTSTYDGLAIAWAAVEHLHDVNGCRALFATHYHELTPLADRLPAAANASLKAKEWSGELVFLHEVGAGAADRSYGVDVARRAGLPTAAIARAREVLERLEGGEGPGEALDDLPLFAVSEARQAAAPAQCADDPLMRLLAEIDPDTLSPREALDMLYRLKQCVEPAQ